MNRHLEQALDRLTWRNRTASASYHCLTLPYVDHSILVARGESDKRPLPVVILIPIAGSEYDRVVKGHQAKHSSTTKPQCQSKSKQAYAGLTTTEERAKGDRLEGHGYGFNAGACLKPMPIVLTGGCLAFQSVDSYSEDEKKAISELGLLLSEPVEIASKKTAARKPLLLEYFAPSPLLSSLQKLRDSARSSLATSLITFSKLGFHQGMLLTPTRLIYENSRSYKEQRKKHISLPSKR
ncbi:hypothetical protein Q3G72_015522 [Acer saccharum]|nr:hypothetical protein Q3G72_004344 [Acer saccharum]KAK1548048.1 hypothetical protein Q3G72_015522 [Acer saccharum]